MLIPQEGEIITEHERLKPVAVLHTPKGEMVLDFGQEDHGLRGIYRAGPCG